MKIVNVGYHYRHPAGFCIERPHGSGDFMLLIIKSQAFINLHGEQLNVSANSAIIFKKDTPQHYGSCGAEYVNDWMHFNLDAEDERFISSLGIKFDTVFPLGESSELSSFVKRLFWEEHSENAHREESVRRYFDLIMLKLSEIISEKKPEREHPYYYPFCTLRNELRSAPQDCRSIDDISRKMKLSRSYVQHLYKLFFGVSITEDVQLCRMEYAQYLLSATDMSVGDVARACGYESDVHFMRLFKRSVGKTPTEFRAQTRISQNAVRENEANQLFGV